MNPTIAGLTAGLMWSMSGLLVSIAAAMPTFQTLMLSWAITASLAFVFKYIKKPFTDYSSFRLGDFFLVLLGFSGSTLCYYLAFQYAPPFEANALNYIWPLLLVAFIAVIDKKIPEWNKILGMGISFVGCVVLLAAKSQEYGFGHITIGHGLAVLGAVIWALYSVIAKERDYGIDVMAPVFLASFIIFSACHFLFEEWVWPDSTTSIVTVTLGLINLAFLLWDHGIRKGDRVLIASMSYFIPLLSVVFMTLGGFGATNIFIGIAGGLIVLGCLFVNITSIFTALGHLTGK
jgi:drug/metabolite transporter (DMT)-like permease